jgi:hypothetical protein
MAHSTCEQPPQLLVCAARVIFFHEPSASPILDSQLDESPRFTSSQDNRRLKNLLTFSLRMDNGDRIKKVNGSSTRDNCLNCPITIIY